MTKQYYKSREEWECLRNELIKQGRIGGSMVGTACGLDPWKSPYTLWAEMTGKIEKADISGREAIRLGHDLEDYVAQRFCDLTGKTVHRENCIMTCDDAPHLFASIDRKVSNEESGLECKTANAYRDGAFQCGNFPDGYFRQVKTYLKVTGLERWYLAVLIMGIDFRVFCITTKQEDVENPPSWCQSVRYVDQLELDECEEEAAGFIALVQEKIAPTMVGTADERGTINAINGNASDGVCNLSIGVEALIERRDELKKRGDTDKEEITRIENEIIKALGTCAEGRSANWKVTYKWSDTKRLDKDAVAAAMGGHIPETCYKVSHGPSLRINPIKKNYK